MKIKAGTKKIIILSSMVILLVVVATLNIVLTLNSSVPTTDNGESVATFFSAYRDDRTTTRDQEFLRLDAIIQGETTTDAAKLAAEEQKLLLVNNIEKELIVEGLIKARGFEDAVVTIGSEKVNVVVKSEEELTRADSTKVFNIVLDELNCNPENIIIIPYK